MTAKRNTNYWQIRRMKTAAAATAVTNHFNCKPQNRDFTFSIPAFSKSPSKARLLLTKAETEIRVCVNRSCNRLGSRQTLEILSDISPPDVSVRSCGCLGRCGVGPNLVLLPGATIISHCGTATQAAEVLVEFCGCSDASTSLSALALRKKGEGELDKGNLSQAEILLSQAIDLKPSGGLHVIYKCRSAARLAMGNYSGALEDAKEAAKIAPGYPQACICQGDALFYMEEYDAAEKAYSSALQIDPSIRRSKSFKARVAKLEEKLTTANASP